MAIYREFHASKVFNLNKQLHFDGVGSKGDRTKMW